MKYLVVSMPLKEPVLNSYLLRNWDSELIEKKTCKCVYLNELDILKNFKTIRAFKSFCHMTLSSRGKNPFRLYRAKAVFPFDIHKEAKKIFYE